MVRQLRGIVGTAILIGSLHVHGAGVLSATHYLENTEPVNGGVEISLEVEITNIGDTPLVDIELAPARSDLFTSIGATSFALETLEPGQSETLSFTIATASSPAIFAGKRAIAFDAQARDASGTPVQLGLKSTSKR